MKKRVVLKLLSPFFAFLSVQATAQPVLTIAEIYTGGDSAQLVNCLSLSSPGPAGANQTWDFSFVLPLDTVTQHVDTVGGPSNVKLITGNTGETFLRITNTKTTVSGLTLGTADVTYDPGALVMRRPMGYQETYNNTFDTDVQADQYHLTGTGENKILADAYGTLITPMGTFENVLRVFVHHHESNHYAIVTQNTDIFSFVWYVPNNPRPIFRIDSTSFSGPLLDTQFVASQYLLIPSAAGVKNVSTSGIKASAHFSGNEIVLNAALQAGKRYKVELIDMKGAKLYESSFTTSSSIEHLFTNNDMATGLYFIKLSELNTATTPTIIKVVKE